MALQRQLVTIPFSQGLDTKTDDKQVAPGKLTLLQNGVFTTAKKIRKRPGTSVKGTSIFGGGSIAAGTAIASLKDELLLDSGGSLYGWSGTEAAWILRGSIPNASVSSGLTFTGNGNVGASDCAISASGIICYVYIEWTVTGGVEVPTNKAVLVDSATGGTISTVTLGDGTYGAPNVVAMAGTTPYFIITYTLTGSCAYRTLSEAGVLGAEVVLSAARVYAYPVSTGTGASAVVFFVYTNVGLTDISIRKLDNALTLGGAVALSVPTVTAISLGRPAIDSSNGNVMIPYWGTEGTKSVFLAVCSNVPAVVGSKILIQASLTAYSGLPCIIVDASGAPRAWYDVPTATGGYDLRTVPCPAYTPGSVATVSKNTILGSGVFISGGVNCVFTVGIGATVSTFLLNALTGAVIARFNDASGSGWVSGNGAGLMSVVQPTAGVFTVPVMVRGATESVSGVLTATTGFRPFSVNLAPSSPPVRAEIGNTLVMAAGIEWMYDGQHVVEVGFHYAPSVVGTPGAAGSMETGSYEYVAVYEWTDATGAVHTSGMSSPITRSVTGPTGSCALDVTTLRVSAKTGCRIAVYRTLTNGTVLKRLAVVANDPTVDVITYTDTASGNPTSSALASSPNLYTTGGVLDNQPPPAFSALTIYRNRLVGISAEDPRQVWYSKQVIPGEPVEFSDFLVLNMDPVGGDCTALASLDDKLLIFKAGVIYYVTGSGPDATGAQNDLSVPILINTNSGCVEPRSVVTANSGVLFQSAKGWFQLDRSLADAYVGFGVEAFNGLTTRSVLQTADTNEARFVLSDGTVLVFDFLFDQWSVFTGLAAVDSTVYGGVVHTVSAAGLVSYENPAVFTDNGTFIELRIKTGWLGAGDLQSFLRLYKMFVLGTWKSAHYLHVWVGYDYRTDVATADKFTISATVDPSPAQYQWRINLAQQKCEAVQLTIYDAKYGESGGESLDISAVTFEVGAKSMPMKMPAARSV